jgi:predicted ATPase
MIRSVAFATDWRCFAKGYRIDLRPGINLLVGDQGSGKSSALTAICCGTLNDAGRYRHPQPCPDAGTFTADHDGDEGKRSLLFFDFERGNPRTVGAFSDNIKAEIATRFVSHGESVNAIIRALPKRGPGVTICMDEPDMALSPRSALALAAQMRTLADEGTQIVAAVHNPWLVGAFPDVLSLEHRRWMPSSEFLESQRAPRAGGRP